MNQMAEPKTSPTLAALDEIKTEQARVAEQIGKLVDGLALQRQAIERLTEIQRANADQIARIVRFLH